MLSPTLPSLPSLQTARSQQQSPSPLLQAGPAVPSAPISSGTPAQPTPAQNVLNAVLNLNSQTFCNNLRTLNSLTKSFSQNGSEKTELNIKETLPEITKLVKDEIPTETQDKPGNYSIWFTPALYRQHNDTLVDWKNRQSVNRALNLFRNFAGIGSKVRVRQARGAVWGATQLRNRLANFIPFRALDQKLLLWTFDWTRIANEIHASYLERALSCRHLGMLHKGRPQAYIRYS